MPSDYARYQGLDENWISSLWHSRSGTQQLKKNAFSVFNDISFLWIKFGSLPPTPRRGALVSHKKRHLERSYCLFKRNFRGALRLAPQKHSRLARLKRFAILLVSSLVRLASSAPGGASALSLPRLGAGLSSPIKKDTPKGVFFYGGEGETRTPAPVTRPTPLAGAPRH